MQSVTDPAAAFRDEDEAEAKRVARRYRAELAERDGVIADLKARLAFVESVDNAQIGPPTWMAPGRPASRQAGTLTCLFTDPHFGEVVKPEQVDYLNAYNAAIAEARLRRWAEKVVEIARDYIKGIRYDGITLLVGGDIFSGTIHQELRETNEETLHESVIHWLELIEATFELLRREFRKMHVVAVVGNHGRMTQKPIAKNRAQDNIEWLLYRLVQRDMSGRRGFTMRVPDAADAHVQVYGHRYLLTHGDQFRGGSGISGAMAPLLLGQHRKTRRQTAAGHPFDTLVCGHWHRYMHLPGLIVGGTLKGTDEYSYIGNFEHQPPTQALWITDPEHGPTIAAPVHVSAGREAEGW